MKRFAIASIDVPARMTGLLRLLYGERLDSVILEATDRATAELRRPVPLISRELNDATTPAD